MKQTLHTLVEDEICAATWESSPSGADLVACSTLAECLSHSQSSPDSVFLVDEAFLAEANSEVSAAWLSRTVVRVESAHTGTKWLDAGAADFVVRSTDDAETTARLNALLATPSSAESIGGETPVDDNAEFLRKLAHDLKNPLNGVIGYLELILFENDLSDQVLGDLESIRTNAENLTAICTRIDDRLIALCDETVAEEA